MVRFSTPNPKRFLVNAQSLSALVYYSPDPDRLANFYRDHVGIPFTHEGHGPIRDHLEAWLGGQPGQGVHLAILKGKAHEGDRGALAPTFKVADLDQSVASMKAGGVKQVRPIFDIGEGKRLASFADVDGNVFSFIEVKQ